MIVSVISPQAVVASAAIERVVAVECKDSVIDVKPSGPRVIVVCQGRRHRILHSSGRTPRRGRAYVEEDGRGWPITLFPREQAPQIAALGGDTAPPIRVEMLRGVSVRREL